VHGDYLWLAIVLVVGSMISLGYYLRVVATMWMGSYAAAPAPVAATVPEGGLPPIAGASQEGEALEEPAQRVQSDGRGGAAWVPVAFVAVLFAAATIFFGIVPQPLFHLANHAGQAISGLFY
jgi:NADH-quinone oxidoreductase subunit N